MKKEIETRLTALAEKLIEYTVVIEAESKTITSKERGVRPVLAILDKGEDITASINTKAKRINAKSPAK